MSRPDRQTGAFCVWSLSECVGRRSATAGRTPTQNAVVRRSTHTATSDKTRLPRLPVDRRRRDAGHAGRQLRLAARPPTRSDVVRHEKNVKHAADCCVPLNLNFFTKRHATRVIYRLTFQTARRSRDSIQTA